MQKWRFLHALFDGRDPGPEKINFGGDGRSHGNHEYRLGKLSTELSYPTGSVLSKMSSNN